jgi:hypothetical protein
MILFDSSTKEALSVRGPKSADKDEGWRKRMYRKNKALWPRVGLSSHIELGSIPAPLFVVL